MHDAHLALPLVGQAAPVAPLPLLQVHCLGLHAETVFALALNFPASHVIQEVLSVASLKSALHDAHFALPLVGQAVPVAPLPLLQVHCLRLHAETVFPFTLNFPAAHVVQALLLSL